MAKKVSPMLYRVSRFFNYKVYWVTRKSTLNSSDYCKYVKDLMNFYTFFNRYKMDLRFLSVYITYFFNYVILNVNFGNFKYLSFGKIVKVLFLLYSKFKLLFLFKRFYIFRFCIQDNFDLFINVIYNYIRSKLLQYVSVKKLYNCIYFFIRKNYRFKYNPFGLKIVISGRVTNFEKAITEKIIMGNCPLQTMTNYIIYKNFVLQTKYGLIGVKIWFIKHL